MRSLLITTVAAALASCTVTPKPADLPAVATGPVDYVEPLPPGFSAQKVKADLDAAIIKRFGEQAWKKAQSAEAWVMSRHYQGMAPPPAYPGAPPPPPIAALLMHERGAWYRAEAGGSFQPLTRTQQEQWLAELARTGAWLEPTYANPTCTDAGATYLIVSMPNRPFLLRAANCATPNSERLGLAAINL
jgi:hypothetical protein